MAKKFVEGVFKAALFAITFVAYWFCLDEKFYRYMDAKLMAKADADKAAYKAEKEKAKAAEAVKAGGTA
jgi:hypothetical protein